MIKTSYQIAYRGNISQQNGSYLWQTQLLWYLMVWKADSLPAKIWNKAKMPQSHHHYSIVQYWKFHSNQARESIQIGREEIKTICSQSYGFSSSHVQMWELDHKEGWAPKNWCFQTVVLKKTLNNPMDSKEIKPVNPKGNQHWIYIGRTDPEAETPKLWPPDAKSWLTGKDPDAGKEKAGGEGDNRGWDGWMASPTQRTWVWANSGRYWRSGKPGVQQWDHEKSDTTEQLNNRQKIFYSV